MGKNELTVDISKCENQLRKPMIIGMVRDLLTLDYTDFVSVVHYLNFLTRKTISDIPLPKDEK